MMMLRHCGSDRMKQYYGDLADALNSCLKEIDAAKMRPKRVRSILEFGRAFAKQMQESKYAPEDTDALDSIIEHLGNMELQVDSKAIKNAFRQTSSMFNVVLKERILMKMESRKKNANVMALMLSVKQKKKSKKSKKKKKRHKDIDQEGGAQYFLNFCTEKPEITLKKESFEKIITCRN